MSVLVPTLSAGESRLATLLRRRGLAVEEIQVGTIVPRAEEIPADADWVVVVSRNSVASLVRSLRGRRPVKIAAVGERTAEALRQAGLAVDFVPSSATSAVLHAELAQRLAPGARVCDFKGYANVSVPLAAPVDLSRHTAAYFTCASSAERLFAVATGATRCLAIGPSTAAALRRLGAAVVVQAPASTLEALARLD